MTSSRRVGGRFKNCLILQMNIIDRLREMRTRGRGVSKIPKICGRHMYMAPNMAVCVFKMGPYQNLHGVSHIENTACTYLDEAPEGGESGARADHDDGRLGPVGQAELRAAHVHRDLVLLALGGNHRPGK